MTKLRTLLALLALTLSFAAAAQVPQLVNYQGRVAVGAVNFDGTGQFKFALVNAAGTTTFWSNDGTSTAGSEPAAAVARTVAKGLYAVLLGDIALANMTAIPASVWSNADVRLRVWFDDGTTGFHRLTPDQRLAPQGYLSDGVVTAAKLASGAVDLGGTKITGVLPAANGGATGANSTLTALSGLTKPATAVTAVTANPTGTAATTEFTAPAHGFRAVSGVTVTSGTNPTFGATAHGFAVGDSIEIGGMTGVGATVANDEWIIAEVPDANSFRVKIGSRILTTTGTGSGATAGHLINISGLNGPGGYGDTGPNYNLNSLAPNTVVSATNLTANTFRITRAGLASIAQSGLTHAYAALRDRPALTISTNGDIYTSTTGTLFLHIENPLNNDAATAIVMESTDHNSPPSIFRSWIMSEQGFTAMGPALRVLSGNKVDIGIESFRTLIDETRISVNGTQMIGVTAAGTAIAGNATISGNATLGSVSSVAGNFDNLATAVLQVAGYFEGDSGLLLGGSFNAGFSGHDAGGTLLLYDGDDSGVYLSSPLVGHGGRITLDAGVNTFTLSNGTASLTVPPGVSGTLGTAAFTAASLITSPQLITISGPAAAVTWTTPAGSFTVARTDAAQTFTGTQTFAGVTTHGSAGTPIKNIRHGRTAALVAGTRTVADPGCSLGTRYFFTVNTLGTVGFPGSYYVSARAAGTSFTVLSNRSDDTSILDWMAIEP